MDALRRKSECLGDLLMSKSLPLLKLSATSIKTYEQCPRKWNYQYVTKPVIEKKDQTHLILGNFVHDVLEYFHNCLQEEPTASRRPLMAHCCQKIHQKSDYITKITPELKQNVLGMLKRYLKKIDDEGLPDVFKNEMFFRVMLSKEDNIAITGKIDRVDNMPHIAKKAKKITDYKGLALDTPIPTPTGWTTMGDLKVGDFVIGSDGFPTKVILKSGVHNRPCYRIVFEDKSYVVCDNVHLWPIGLSLYDNILTYTKVVDADDLYALFLQDKHKMLFVNTLESGTQGIEDISVVSSVPTQCISVEAEDALYACGTGYTLSHNTGKSKYLDDFQLKVYGIPVFDADPDLEEYEGSYLCLQEDCKEIPYTITRDDVEKTKEKILQIAQDIRNDKTWETKPQFLCKWCDYYDVCPDAFGKSSKPSMKPEEYGETKWS